MRISEIVAKLGNDLGIEELRCDADFATLALATADIDLPFCTFIDDMRYVQDMSHGASMVITTADIADQFPGKGVCLSQNPRISFFRMHNYLSESQGYLLGHRFETEIGSNCKISGLACIADHNVKIGNNVIIEEFVSIKENTVIGDNTFIGAGTVVGGEGFEFKRLPNNEVLAVRHTGWVRIGDNVHIQQNVCIDKAIYPWDETVVGDFCKMDNFVHIAHGVKLGQAVFFAAGAVTGGRTVIGDRAWIGVGATVSNGLVVGADARVNIGAIATQNVDTGSSVTGNFAIEHKKFIEFIKSIR